jgi:hypothetical protein
MNIRQCRGRAKNGIEMLAYFTDFLELVEDAAMELIDFDCKVIQQERQCPWMHVDKLVEQDAIADANPPRFGGSDLSSNGLRGSTIDFGIVNSISIT